MVCGMYGMYGVVSYGMVCIAWTIRARRGRIRRTSSRFRQSSFFALHPVLVDEVRRERNNIRYAMVGDG